MVDQYTDSDEPSVGHRKLFFDIEVEVTEGFPDVMKAYNMITSIALYDDTTSTYYTFVTDPKKQIEDYKKDDTIVEFYDTEHAMLTRFFKSIIKLNQQLYQVGIVSSLIFLIYTIVLEYCETVTNSLSPIGIVYYNEYKKTLYWRC